jgi:hypothetical protein
MMEQAQLLSHFGNRSCDSLSSIAAAAIENFLGAEESSQAGGGCAQDGKSFGGFFEVAAISQFEGAPDDDAEHSDFVGQARGEKSIEVGQFAAFEMSRVETMLEGVLVSKLTAAFAGLVGGSAGCHI